MDDRSLGGRVAEDRRVRRTREAIQRALLDLMVHKGYDAVTVQDIIDRADIGRSTFYSHFTDKRDALMSTMDEVRVFLQPDPAAPASGGLFGFSLRLFEHTHQQRQLYRALVGRHGGGLVAARIEQLIAEAVRDELVALLPEGREPAVPVDAIVRFVVGAYSAVLRGWHDGEFPGTPREADAAFRALAEPGVRAVLGLPAATSAAVPGSAGHVAATEARPRRRPEDRGVRRAGQ